jgi:DNA integrity scanning protein DisA with diadenylate cyclase activity
MPTKKTATGPARMQIGVRVDMDLYDEVKVIAIRQRRRFMDLYDEVKVIAIRQRRRFNDMIEEAMKDLMEKYKNLTDSTRRGRHE